MGSGSGKVAPDFLEMMCQISTLYQYAGVPKLLKKVIEVERKEQAIEACSLAVGMVG